ncbi:hypothetical protein K402DRAFT_419256 [Aulographum hederae CBS 113979]|uniref:SRR1-like domain-containing protein n=1 Tax=Aulographum hederae CBS 113979 TaxID=1176131 RepID=A0A6G1H6R4_9PEZI|nr:hypothetical protein K402DRAFT_419256 [Aulographum hederae CBS 113979]
MSNNLAGWYEPPKSKSNPNSSRQHRKKTKPSLSHSQKRNPNVALDDGWNLVTNPPSARRLQSSVPNSSGILGKGINDNAGGNGKIQPGLSLEGLKLEFARMETQYKESACARRVQGIVDTWRKSSGEVANAVCLALGSFSAEGGGDRMRSLWQLVLFMFVVEELRQSRKGEEMEVFAQEPRFTDLDVEFLTALGVDVVQPPEAKNRIEETSFLYAPFLQWEVLLPGVLHDARPTLFLGNDVAGMAAMLQELGKYGLGVTSHSGQEGDEISMDVVAECAKIARDFWDLYQGRGDVGSFEEHETALRGLVMMWKEDEPVG